MAVQQNLSSYLKEIEGDISQLVPAVAVFQQEYGFSEGEKIGKHFRVPTQLTGEHGFSYGSGAFLLNPSIAHDAQDALVTAKSTLLRMAIPYDQASRASDNKKAFGRWADSRVIPFVASARKRLEIDLVYGQSGVGQVSSVSGSGPWVLTISAATFAPGIWVGAENAAIDIYSAITAGTQRNTGALAITSVDIEARTITVAGTAAGIAANDHLFFFGSRGNVGQGLDAIITQTTGTLYNIPVANYSLYRGGSLGVAGNLTYAKVVEAGMKAANKGLDDGANVYCSNKTFSFLANDQAQLRRYDQSYREGKLKNGADSIEFFSPAGTLKIVNHPCIKEGEAFLVPASRSKVKRIGSTDWTMKMPGDESEDLVLMDPTLASYEMRYFTEQSLYVSTPGQAVKLTGITNV